MHRILTTTVSYFRALSHPPSADPGISDNFTPAFPSTASTMGAVVVSAFALALFCFLILSCVSIGTLFAFCYRRYYGLQRSPVADVEAQTHPSSSAGATAKAEESAILSDSSKPHAPAVAPSPPSSDATPGSDVERAQSAKLTSELPPDEKSTWKRRTVSWALTDDIHNRLSLVGTSITKATAKVKEKWASFDSDTSLATTDVAPLSDDVPSTHPQESSSLYSQESASYTQSPPSRAGRPVSAPVDAVSTAKGNALPSPMPEESASTPRSPTPKQSAPTPSRKSTSMLASIKLTSALSDLALASSASTPSLASSFSTPATAWEPQTPLASTTIPSNAADRPGFQPSPSVESLEVRSADYTTAALPPSEAIPPSGSLPSCVSGLSDVLGCLGVRGSLIEDLAKTAVHPTLGLGFDASWLSQAAISISLRAELPISRATSPVPPKVIDPPPRRRPALSTSNTIAPYRGNAGLRDSALSSDSKTACGPEPPEPKTDDERHAALMDALSTTFSIYNLLTPDSARHSAVSASTSSTPSVAYESDLDLGLDTSYELSYDASESEFDGFCASDDEECKVRPSRARDRPLHQSSSRSETSVLTF